MRRLLILLAALLMSAGALSLGAQDAALRDTFHQAKALWGTQGDRDGASARFEQVLATLEPKGRALDAEWTQILCETYNWLAVLDDRTPAKKARAPKHLEAILDLQPDFEIDRNLTNARLQGLFDNLRAQKLARLKLTATPEGGVLTVDGKVRPAGVLPRYLAPGPHTLMYAKPGFQSVQLQVELVLKEAKALDFKLERVSSTVTLHTAPAGAEVILDGKPLGATRGMADGSARALAEKAGVPVEQLSEPIVLADLAPGSHILEFRAPCFRPKRLELDPSFATPFADHLLEVVKLEASRGRLSVTAPVAGELLLNGKPHGPVPVQDLQVCSGTYDLQIRFPAGGFSRRLEVPEGQSVSVEAQPRPRLAVLGIEGGDTFSGRDRLQRLLEDLGTRLSTVAVIPPVNGESPEQALARIRTQGEAELTLRVRPVQAKPIYEVELILATLSGEEERTTVKPLEQDPFGALVARMQTLPPLWETHAGFVALDLPGEPGPWVLQAEASALQAGLVVGKPLLQVNGKPVAHVAALRAALAEAKGPVLAVSQGGPALNLPLTRQALEVPLGSSAYCYPQVISELRLRTLGAKGDDAGFLRLNQALALMHFRAYDKAMEILRDARVGVARGVSQGTLDFYTGLCLLRMGNVYTPEAIQALNQALKYPQATLFGPEGPLVAPLARQALEDLKP